MEQKLKVREYFDRMSLDYRKAYEFDEDDPIRTYIFNERKRIVLSLIDRQTGRLLDIGCGPAVMTKELLKSDFLIYNTDISSSMIDEARRALKGCEGEERVQFRVSDMEHLDFEDSYFNVILCIGVIEYLEDYREAIDILARILKKGGILIISIPNKRSIFETFDNLFMNIFLRIKPLSYTKYKNIRDSGIITKKFIPSSFARELARYGLVKTDMRFHGYRLAVLRRLFPRFWVFFNDILNRASPFLPKSLLANDCVMKFEKR